MENKKGGRRPGAGRPRLPDDMKSKRKHYNWYVTPEEREHLLAELEKYRKDHAEA